jgi:hypothetical protein
MHLAISYKEVQISYFSNLWIRSYGCLNFLGEIWAGQACAGANEEELTLCANIWRQEVGRRGQRGGKEGAKRVQKKETCARMVAGGRLRLD